MNRRMCFKVRSRLGELFDGRLSAAEKAEIEAHIRSCRSCRTEQESYDRGVENVRALPSEDLPEGFAFTVLARNRERVRWQAARRWGLSLGAVVGLVIFAAPGETLKNHLVQGAVHQPAAVVDYVDAGSLQPIELDYALHRAHENHLGLRLTPVVYNLDDHRRRVVEAAAFAELQKDLDRFGAAASEVEIAQPIELDTGSPSPFVVAVDSFYR